MQHIIQKLAYNDLNLPFNHVGHYLSSTSREGRCYRPCDSTEGNQLPLYFSIDRIFFITELRCSETKREKRKRKKLNYRKPHICIDASTYGAVRGTKRGIRVQSDIKNRVKQKFKQKFELSNRTVLLLTEV